MIVLALHIAPISGLAHLLAHPFFRHAFVAGTAVAACSGLVGYFMVLRSQVFTGDALSHVAVTGALGALAFGLDARLGLFVATIAVAVGLGLLGPRGRADDVVIGSVFAWVLGVGVLFLSIFTTQRATGDSAAGTSVLFGSIFGLDTGQTWVAVLVAVGVIAAMLFIARPLLFASVDASVAAARGLPVTALGLVFLALVGATAAEATQAVGALLLLGLMAGPAGAAQRLTARPFRAMWLSVAIAVGSVWIGLLVSNAVASVPPSFAILAVSTGVYAVTLAGGAIADRRASGAVPSRNGAPNPKPGVKTRENG
jgi:zinc/manganese transport system permease protein